MNHAEVRYKTFPSSHTHLQITVITERQVKTKLNSLENVLLKSAGVCIALLNIECFKQEIFLLRFSIGMWG